MTTADADGRLQVTDRRVISALLRRRWVAERRHRRGKRRWWTITHAENPIGHRDTLADAVELLIQHLVRDHRVRDFAPTEATADGKELP